MKNGIIKKIVSFFVLHFLYLLLYLNNKGALKMINDKEYKKLEVRILKNLLYKFGYKVKQYTIKKTKHKDIPTKLYIENNDPFISNAVSKKITEYLSTKNIENYTFERIEYIKKNKNNLRRRNRFDQTIKYFTFKLDRNIDIEVYKGLLKLQGII